MKKAYSDEEVAEIVHAAHSRLPGEDSPLWEEESEDIRQSYIEDVRKTRSGITHKQYVKDKDRLFLLIVAALTVEQ